MAASGVRAYKQSLGVAWRPSQSPWWGWGTKPVKAESFLYTFVQKRGQKYELIQSTKFVLVY